jgi:hypothetical protein
MTYVFPLLILGGIAFYYFRIYRKGKAAGGGMMEGFKQNATEKWKATLEPGEVIFQWSYGWVPLKWWQALLYRYAGGIFRLMFTPKCYNMCFTDRGRILVGRVTALGAIAEQRGFQTTAIRVEGVQEEKQGLAMKLNPLVPKDHKTFSLKLILPDATYEFANVDAPFVEKTRAGARGIVPAG